LGNLRAEAATPEDVLVMGKTIDNMIAMDPAQAYEFSDSSSTATYACAGLVRQS
jgi:hypothetical protein